MVVTTFEVHVYMSLVQVTLSTWPLAFGVRGTLQHNSMSALCTEDRHTCVHAHTSLLSWWVSSCGVCQGSWTWPLQWPSPSLSLLANCSGYITLLFHYCRAKLRQLIMLHCCPCIYLSQSQACPNYYTKYTHEIKECMQQYMYQGGSSQIQCN